jgi:hypothetical protein
MAIIFLKLGLAAIIKVIKKSRDKTLLREISWTDLATIKS